MNLVFLTVIEKMFGGEIKYNRPQGRDTTLGTFNGRCDLKMKICVFVSRN